MAVQTFDGGTLRVAYPDTFEAPRDLTDDHTRTRATDRAAIDNPASLLVDALGDQQFTLVRPLELTSQPSPGRTRRLTEPETWTVELGVDADESAVLLVDHDGVLSWQPPDRRTERPDRSVRSAGVQSAATLTFELAVGGSTPDVGGRTRSFNLLGALGRVRIYVLKFAAGAIAGLAIKHLERDVQQGLVRMASSDPKHWQLTPTLTDIALPTDRAARILLFVHGTFSSTLGSYAGLAATPEGKAFLDKAIGSYDAVIGFDHATLSCDPLQNATDLLERLSIATVPAPPTIDIVCYSRGALVARSLVENLLPSAQWQAIAGHIVFVGAPNSGTSIVNPKKWARFLDLYTNLALASIRIIGLITGGLPMGEIAGSLIKGAGAFAKYLVAYGVGGGGVPGLAAMDPDGEFVRNLNETQPGQPGPGAPWYVISSEFEPSKISGKIVALPAELKQRLVDGLADQLFGVPNDLVVDTASMSAIDPAGGSLVAGSLPLPPNGEVHHLTYFVQPPVAHALQTWLVNAIRSVPTGSVVAQELPWHTERKIAVLDANARVREARNRLKARPPMVVIRNTGGSFTRDVSGHSGDAISASTGDVSGGIDYYPIDLETATGAVEDAADDRMLYDLFDVDNWLAAPTIDIGDLATNWLSATHTALPRGVVLLDGAQPLAVVPESVGPMPIDELVNRRQPAQAELIANEPEPETPAPPCVRLTAQMPDRVKRGTPVAVACTLSREGTVITVDGEQGVFTPLEPNRDVVIRLITVSNAELSGKTAFSFPTPTAGHVERFFFEVIPTRVGSCTVWVVATQGEEQLLTLVLQAVSEAEVTAVATSPSVEASVPVVTEAQSVGSQQLVIWEKTDGTKVSYEYDLTNDALQLMVHGSSPTDLGDRQEFVAGIYSDLESARTAADEDAEDFLANLQDLGSDLFSILFPKNLQRALWKNRGGLTRLVVRSSEPFIPWELIHLKDPDGDGARPAEPMFLGQLGLVRWLNAENVGYPPKVLRNKRVRALCARYLNPKTRTLEAIDAEEAFLEETLNAVMVEPTKKALDALFKSGEFDIFHFAGHGLARQAGLKDTVIQLGDVRKSNGAYLPIMVNDRNVRQNAVLNPAQTGGPLVFLNACQAGRTRMQLGSMGGFAQAFLCRGAGAFVSTLWSVGDDLARTFSEEFYAALLAGEEVSSAVRRAREKGRQSQNISWLAYVVYANPAAKFEAL